MTKRMSAYLVGGVILGGVVAYLWAGVVVVAPGEVVVVRRLGRWLDRPWGPGLHAGLPVPLEQRDRVRIEEVRRLEVGLAGLPGPTDDPALGEFLTGDRNLLQAQAIVQFRVVDPQAFVTRVDRDRMELMLERLAESSLARAISSQGIDDVLRVGRAAIAQAARDDLAGQVETLDLGLTILGVSLTETRPPVEVAPAFAEAQSALSARDQRLQDAVTYEATTLTAAKAEADARLQQAHAEADRLRVMAAARAERFEALRVEAARDRRLTIRRLYLDALRELLPGVGRTLVVTPDDPLDLSIIGKTRPTSREP